LKKEVQKGRESTPTHSTSSTGSKENVSPQNSEQVDENDGVLRRLWKRFMSIFSRTQQA